MNLSKTMSNRKNNVANLAKKHLARDEILGK